MSQPLYALKDDLDMVAAQVYNLTKTLSDLDQILHRVVKNEIEQSAMAKHLDMLEQDVKELKFRIGGLTQNVQGLTQDLQKLTQNFHRLEREMMQRFERLEERMDRTDEKLKLLDKIAAHLGII